MIPTKHRIGYAHLAMLMTSGAFAAHPGPNDDEDDEDDDIEGDDDTDGDDDIED